MITFKNGNKENINEFLAFFKKSIKELFPYYSKNSVNYTIEVDYGSSWLRERLEKRVKKVILAMEEKKIIGYLLFTKSVAGVSYADWLAVEKSYQKKGVASKLLALWEKTAEKEGAHSLQLWTTEDKVSFYENRGFILGGKFPKSWHGVDSYLIYKILREPKEENYLKEYLTNKLKKE